MTEGSARDDDSDTVDTRASTSGGARPGAVPPDAVSTDPDRPGASAPEVSEPDASVPDVSLADTSLADTSLPETNPPDDTLSDDGEHAQHGRDQDSRGDAHAHEQPTRPAYGHLYGVERSLDSFLPLQDVVFAVDEAFLEALRDFAAHALDDMRRLGADYDHLHFRDVAQVWHESWPDIILVAPRPPADQGAQAASGDDAQDVDPASDR